MPPTPDFRRTNERLRLRLQTGRGDARAIEACGAELQALAREVSGALEAEFLRLTQGAVAS
jgi:hypothetical protein